MEAQAPRGRAAGGRVKYRIECEVSVRGGPWTAYWVNVEARGGSVPSARRAAWIVKDNAALGTGRGPETVEVRGTRVLRGWGAG